MASQEVLAAIPRKEKRWQAMFDRIGELKGLSGYRKAPG
jgi:hypothetical protein